MCLYAGSSHANNNGVVFQPCPTVRNHLFQWGLDGSSMFHSTYLKGNPGVATQEAFCVTINSTAKSVFLNKCTADGNLTTWRPDSGVGAGMAGDSTNQLVNYKQFSRCLDVTNKEVGSTYMIAWFCKQDPSGNVELNQQWVHPVPVLPEKSKTGPIEVNNPKGTSTDPTKNYCLKSPGNAASNIYVTVELCTTAAQKLKSEYQWTVWHDTGDYGTSYRIMDKWGFCLTPTDLTVSKPDTHSDGTSKVKVAVCNSTDLQKWNAPANINLPTPLTDLVETTGQPDVS
jgi:hypothetical protein